MDEYSYIHTIGSEETIRVANPTKSTPPSTPEKRAALHRFPGATLADLSRVPINREDGEPYRSVVGIGRGMQVLKADSVRTKNVSQLSRVDLSLQHLTDAKRLSRLEVDLEELKTQSKGDLTSLRKDLKKTNAGMIKNANEAKALRKELHDVQVSTLSISKHA
jgi:pyruvate/2-oxoglutarate dehydrogenase complex dihydrolipoamide acyltransferase (E2) component